MKNHRSFIVACLCGLIGSTPVFSGEPSDPSKNYLGINMWFLNDYNGAECFVNMMKQCRNWKNYAWNATVAVDSDYWPMGDCSAVVFGASNALGVYKLVFKGSGTASVAWASATVSNMRYDTATNTSTADLNLTNAATGILRFSGTRRTLTAALGSGITDVRLYRPGYPADGSVVFTREILILSRKFHLIRYMDWVSTNTNPLITWTHRQNPVKGPMPALTAGGRTGNAGTAMEHFIQLCNQSNTDLWMNIPVFADDDYIRKTAQIILYGSDGVNPYTSPQAAPVYPPLNPGLKVYIEYANEVWNTASGFMCYGWIKSMSDAIIANTTAKHPIVFDNNRDQYTAIARYTGNRTVEISSIMRQVFGDAAMMTRVRPLLMGQIGGNWFLPRSLPFLDAYYGTYRPATDPYPNTDPHPLSYYTYGAGGSAYYGVNNWSTDPNTFFAAGNYPAATFISKVGDDAVWARNYGLKRIAYEGGMGLDNTTLAATDAQQRTLNADPRMRDLTVAYHDAWSSIGGDLLTYYCLLGPASWEFTPSLNNSTSPKLRAIDALRDSLQRAPVTLGGAAPGTIIVPDQRAQNMTISSGNFFNVTPGGETAVGGIDVGEWIASPVSVAQPGWYSIVARGAGTGVTAQLWVNGMKKGDITIGSTTPVNSAPVAALLDKGLNVIRFRVAAGGASLRSLAFTFDSALGTSRPPAALRTAATALRIRLGASRFDCAVPLARITAATLLDAQGRTVSYTRMQNGLGDVVLPACAGGVYVLRMTGAGGGTWSRQLMVR